MPPKRAAPKPAGFDVASLQAGRRTWTAGRSGPLVKLDGAPAGLPRREVILVGKVLFGRDRLAFEVQELDFDPANVKRLARLEKERDREASGGWGSESDEAPCRGDDFLHMVAHIARATELAAKHSIQVKFEDIEQIEICGGRLQMSLSKAPQCYIKPAGDRRGVNMEVGQDITKGAKTITVTAAPAGEVEARSRRQENLRMLSLEALREELARHSPRLAALLQGLPAPAPAPAATPRGKKRAAAGEELGGTPAKQARTPAAAKDAAAVGAVPQPVVAPEGTWLKKAVEQFGLCGPVDETLKDDWWKMYVQERQSLEKEAREGESDNEEFDPYQAEQTEPTRDILARVRAAVKATVASSTSVLDPNAVAGGVYLCSCYACMDEEDPRTVEAKALVFSPFANGRVVHIAYRNHFRARMSFTERDSHMCAFRGVFGQPPPPERLWEKLLDLDYNEFRRKNKVKTSIATKTTIAGLCSHLFGSESALSSRKTFGLLVRAAGLGQYKESNGWPVAVMRRRFKCMPGEEETDTEKISGEGDEEPGSGGCCVM